MKEAEEAAAIQARLQIEARVQASLVAVKKEWKAYKSKLVSSVDQFLAIHHRLQAALRKVSEALHLGVESADAESFFVKMETDVEQKIEVIIF
jgi:hypothetical protein